MKNCILVVAFLLSTPLLANQDDCVNEGTLDNIVIKGDKLEFEVVEAGKVETLEPNASGAPVDGASGHLVPGARKKYSMPLKGPFKALCESSVISTLLEARNGRKLLCVRLDPGKKVRDIFIKKERSILKRSGKAGH